MFHSPFASSSLLTRVVSICFLVSIRVSVILSSTLLIVLNDSVMSLMLISASPLSVTLFICLSRSEYSVFSSCRSRSGWISRWNVLSRALTVPIPTSNPSSSRLWNASIASRRSFLRCRMRTLTMSWAGVEIVVSLLKSTIVKQLLLVVKMGILR